MNSQEEVRAFLRRNRPVVSSDRVRRLVTAAVSMGVAAVIAGCSPTPPAGDAASTANEAPPPVTSSVPAPSLAEGASVRKVIVDGSPRNFRVYRPAGLVNPAPLVMAFHGYGGSAALAESQLGWNAVAEREGVVVVYPDGVNASFNAGICCGTATETGVDDVAAAVAMVDDVAKVVPLDDSRLYVTGFSNGAAMTYRMACETNRFAAFGAVGGGQVVDCPSREPTSILHIHGLADTVVPVEGGQANGMGHPAVAETLSEWRNVQGCAPPVETGSGRVHQLSSQCPAGREISLITVDGLSHDWPSATDGLDATETLWQFFAAHPEG